MRIEHAETVSYVRVRFPHSFEQVIPMPFDNILNMQGWTMLRRAMIKNILDFILARLISSRMERWYVISVGLRAIIADSGLEL